MGHDRYESPLSTRYASKAMAELFSSQFKYTTWRRLWIALAEAQHELGLSISKEQINQLREHETAIDFALVDRYEKETHHDVIAHINAYSEQCPAAKPIIHLGATSCFVTDNTDVIQIHEGLNLLEKKLLKVIEQLAEFAEKHQFVACLGFTHFQPAQLTTVGKRACLWLQDFLIDYEQVIKQKKALKFLGAKGATGTQASFLALFKGNHLFVEKLDLLVAQKMGFSQVFHISGQTYTRKQDIAVLQTLSNIAVSAHKFATDLRLLAHLKEMEEGFGKNQVGSSAMPHKRNPIKAERICSLARFLISLQENSLYTAATQWLERTLDDSANRRLCLPEAFLVCDGILDLLLDVTSHLVIYPVVIARHVSEELPFLALENILMACVQKGGDRQTIHERLRKHSHEMSQKMKEEGTDNTLLEQISSDSLLNLSTKELEQLLDISAFIGMAPQQTQVFLQKEIYPLLKKVPQNFT